MPSMMGSEVDVRPRSPAKKMDHTSSPYRDRSEKAAWCQFCQRQPPSGALEQLHQLEVILPDYEHTVCAFEPLEDGAFNASIKLKVTTEEDAKTWLSAFQASSKTTWRVKKTYPVTAEKARHNKYRVDLRCQRKQPNPSSKKNTFCPAVLYLVLKKDSFSQERKSRSMDPHYQNQLYLHVNIQSKHNHEMNFSEAQQRDVSRETIEKLQHLFKNGHSPSSALTTIKYDLQEELGKNYVFASADRSICPDLHFCYRLYYKIFRKSYGEASGAEMLHSLRHKIDSYNHEQGEECAKMSCNENEISIVLCSPLMKRVHKNIRQSGEFMFLDSSGNCDKLNIFLLLTQNSVPGGVPLGVFVTSSESERNLSDGLELLKAILPHDAFFGRGKLGPRRVVVAVSGDCEALRRAVKTTFPESHLVLCVSSILQAMRRWLWQGHNGIHKNDRRHLLKVFRQLVYAKNPTDLEARYSKALRDLVVAKYAQFKIQLEDVFEKRDLWASHLPTDNSVNSFVESAMRALKDKIFHRLKAYNIAQVVDFLTTRLEAYYSRRLINVANNKNSSPDVSASEKKLFYHIATGLKQECSEIPAPDPSDEMTSTLILPESPPTNPVLLTKQREDAEMDLRNMFGDLLEKLKTDDSFIIPIQAFTSSFNKISTDSNLISALNTFGKTHRKSSTAKTPRTGQQTSAETGVRPTAAARRKTPGGGRCVITGRPAKKARVEAAHKMSAPHKVSQCVSEALSQAQ